MTNKNSRVAAVIPARFGSTRFPGKVLANLCGKPLVQWVYEKAAASKAAIVLVAADDKKVADAVESFGGKAVMTSPSHPSGTDRIHEAVSKLDCDIIINVQGDEPLIPVKVIDELIDLMVSNPSIEMATVAVPCPRKTFENNPNMVKVVFDSDNFALYFSRSIIPFLREGGEDTPTYLHWGIYAYRRETLAKIVSLPESRLEKCQKLEQLRALDNGIRIYVNTSNLSTIGVDTPEDLEKAEKRIREELGK